MTRLAVPHPFVFGKHTYLSHMNDDIWVGGVPAIPSTCFSALNAWVSIPVPPAIDLNDVVKSNDDCSLCLIDHGSDTITDT